MKHRFFCIVSFLGVIICLAYAVLPAGLIFGAEHELPVPVIAVNPDVYYPLEEVLYLEGSAKPDTTVQIQFQKQGVRAIQLVSKADANGEWVLTEKVPLEAGEWEVRARAISQEKTSEWSNPRLIKAIATGIVLGGVVVKFGVLILIIAVLLLFALGLFWYTRMQVRTAKAEYEKKLQEKERESAVALIEKNFTEFRQKLAEELDHIERRMEKGELTDEEKEHREHLVRELKEAEEAIEKKVKSME